jgi:hypothetical protein
VSEPSAPTPTSPPPPDPAAARWAARLARFSAGSQSVVAFCAAEGISTSKFYHWRNRLARPATPPPARSPVVVPLRVSSAPAAPTPVEVALPSGTVVRFPAGTTPEFLAAVIRGLEERPC